LDEGVFAGNRSRWLNSTRARLTLHKGTSS
jgi:hypothetical protein